MKLSIEVIYLLIVITVLVMIVLVAYKISSKKNTKENSMKPYEISKKKYQKFQKIDNNVFLNTNITSTNIDTDTISAFKEKKDDFKVGAVQRAKYMCKACEFAKVITNECYNRGYSVSAAKLQKLLVIIHGEHLAKYNKPLFNEDVLRCMCGVAIKEVEVQFLLYDFSKKEKVPEQIAVLETERNTMNKVLDEYGSLDVVEINKDERLIELTTDYPYEKGVRTVIPNEDIKRVFVKYKKTND